jgi:hypothetical protein
MPLSNNNFQWRPNDNSGKTLLRYRLEAEKWYDALTDIHKKSVSTPDHGVGFIFSLLSFLLCLILLSLIGIVKLLILILGGQKKYDDRPITRKDYSDKLLRMPVREDYPTEQEYLDVLGAYMMNRNH